MLFIDTSSFPYDISEVTSVEIAEHFIKMKYNTFTVLLWNTL